MDLVSKEKNGKMVQQVRGLKTQVLLKKTDFDLQSVHKGGKKEPVPLRVFCSLTFCGGMNENDP